MTDEGYTAADINWPAPQCPGHNPIGPGGPRLMPFAVIVPIAPSPARLAELAAALDGLAWARQIIGIDQMRRGQRPQTPCDLLGVPSLQTRPCEPVALVFVGWEHFTEVFGRELIERVAGLATACSPEFYSDTNR